MKRTPIYLSIAALILVTGGTVYFSMTKNTSLRTNAVMPAAAASDTHAAIVPANQAFNTSTTINVEPLVNALARVTKKPFGLYVTPKNSPVTPEHFTGFHTGTDFETLPVEQNIAVPVYAICPGTVLVKRTASGYGGVFVASCTLGGQAVTVVYGHLALASINLEVGATVYAGEKIGVLGKGFSAETDGERKHLHLGIHKGTAINILGYVKNKSDLGAWLNVLDYLK